MKESLDLLLFLDKVDIFRNLSIEKLGQIAFIAETDQFEEGETLFHPGDPGNHAYIIVTGSIELLLKDGRGGRQT